MNYKQKIFEALEKNEKNQAVTWMQKAFSDGVSVIRFYEEIVSSIMNEIHCESDDPSCIWKEHQMTAIMRSLIEISYTDLVKHKQCINPKKSVLIACPKDETHDLGALIGSHLFSYKGFKTTFLGADTPLSTLNEAIKYLNIDYLVISATNAFHLFEIKNMIETIKTTYPDIKVIGAGHAFKVAYSEFKHAPDYIMDSMDDIDTFIKREGLTCSP